MSIIKNNISHEKSNIILSQLNQESPDSLPENNDEQTTPLIDPDGVNPTEILTPTKDMNSSPSQQNAIDTVTISLKDCSDDEATEELLEPIIPQVRKSKRRYVLLGIIAGVCILTALAFLIPAQMKAAEINKVLDLGDKYLEEGKYEEAILAFDDVIAIEPKQVEAYEGKGASNIGLKNFPEAETQLETAKTIKSTDNGNVLLAEVYISTNRKDQGKSLLDDIVNKHPEEIKVVIHASKLYSDINEYSKVIELLENKISNTTNKEDHKKLYNELINGFVKAGKPQEEILALLERAASATGDQSYLQKKESFIVKKPSFNLAPGEYKGAQTLEIVKGNAVDKIFYTIDGSEPSLSSTEYTGPISLNPSEITVKMIEVNEIGVKSPVLEGKYSIKENKLNNEEFIGKLYGIWYFYAGGLNHVLYFSNAYCVDQIWAGSLGHNSGGYFEVENTTQNGGTIKITKCHEWKGTVSDYHPQAPAYFEFNFGVPDDNKINVREFGGGGDGKWYEWTAGESLGGDQYRLPIKEINNSEKLTTFNLFNEFIVKHLQHEGSKNFG